MKGFVGQKFKFRLMNSSKEKELAHDLVCARINISAIAYAKYSVAAAVVLSALMLYLLNAFVELELAYLMLVYVLFVLILYIMLLRLPKFIARNRALAIETDLPVQLRSISTELAIGVPFDKALESVSQWGGESSEVFSSIISNIQNGMSPADAFDKARNSVDSRMLDKALSHLMFLYRYGYEESGLSKLVDEISAEHRSRMKEYASRSSVMGVILIALSSVVPALATTYILVGSSFMDISLTKDMIYFIYVIALPALILLMLLATRALSPVSSQRGSEFMSQNEFTKFTIFLSKYGINMPARKFIAFLFLLSLIAAAVLFILTSSMFSLLLILSPLVIYGIFLYVDDMRISNMEDYMPDALFYAASLHNFGMEKVIEEIANTNYGELSSEFGRAHRQIKAGFSVRVALQSISDRNNSPVVERGIALLIKIHEVGASLENALKKTAEDIHDMFLLLKERSSILSMQKYNLMVACFLVPLIFGAVLSLVSSLDLSYIETLLAVSSSKALLPAVRLSINIYLVEFSLLASLFMADYSGSWKRFMLYFIFLLPMMFLLYYAAQTLL